MMTRVLDDRKTPWHSLIKDRSRPTGVRWHKAIVLCTIKRYGDCSRVRARRVARPEKINKSTDDEASRRRRTTISACPVQCSLPSVGRLASERSFSIWIMEMLSQCIIYYFNTSVASIVSFELYLYRWLNTPLRLLRNNGHPLSWQWEKLRGNLSNPGRV
jgi:hypothetical protein